MTRIIRVMLDRSGEKAAKERQARKAREAVARRDAEAKARAEARRRAAQATSSTVLHRVPRSTSRAAWLSEGPVGAPKEPAWINPLLFD